MRDIFFFDSMLTPKIITIVYWILLFAVVVSGIGSMFAGKFLWGLVDLVGGAVGARIWCELLIVLFKINDNIKQLAEPGKEAE